MVSHQEKNQAIQFICKRLEDSGLYLIRKLSRLEILAEEKSDLNEEPKKVGLILANFFPTIRHFQDYYHQNKESQIYTAPVLYKDEKTAFVRMVERNLSWRQDKSLKNYTEQEINQMLHLRGIEKAVGELMGEQIEKELIYYQPSTERLEESLRLFSLQPVDLDYSHIGPEDQGYGFVQDRESIDYKLPREVEILGPAIQFDYDSGFIAKIASAEISEKEGEDEIRCEEELQEIAQRQYPELEPEEALEKMYPDD